MYELYSKIRNDRGFKDSDVAKGTGITKSTFSDWKSGRSKPSTEKLMKIADFLDTSIEYLDEWPGTIVTCPDCGLTYDITHDEDVSIHEKEHFAWKQAREQFGTLYCNYAINEKIKAKCRNIKSNLSLPLEERYAAELKILKCLFSRSVVANSYDLRHVSFADYVSISLNDPNYRSHVAQDVFLKLKNEYGIKSGKLNGSIYEIPEKVKVKAAHLDGKDFTEEQWRQIESFAKYIKKEDSN